jgi:hypothetical protein
MAMQFKDLQSLWTKELCFHILYTLATVTGLHIGYCFAIKFFILCYRLIILQNGTQLVR